MQKTLQFQKANPLQQLTGLARAMALPHEYAPQRFPSFPALERTAVMGFNVPTSITIPSSGLRAVLFRQAAYPLWVDNPAGATSWAYQVTLATQLVERQVAGGDYEVLANVSAWRLGNQLATSSVVGVIGAVSPVGPLMGWDQGTGPYPWFYSPAGGTMAIALNVDAGTIPTTDPLAAAYLQRWSAPGEVVDASDGNGLSVGLTWNANSKSQVGLLSTPIGGWYRVKAVRHTSTSLTITNANFSISVVVVGGAATIANVGTPGNCCTIQATTNGSVAGLVPIAATPEFANSSLPFSSTRTTAAAALFTNVTKALNKEGTVLCGRLNPTVTNVWNFGPADLATLHPAEKQLLGLETGAYTFCPPSTDMAMFWDYTLPTGTGAPATPIMRLDNDALVNCLYFADPDGGTSLAVNLDWHIEFRTTSTLFQIGMSTTPIEVLHQAQLSLAAAGFFFQNETHESVLKRVVPMLSTAAKLLLPGAGPVMNAAGVVSKAYKIGSMLVDNRPRGPPPATSVAAATRAKPPPKPPKKQGKQKDKSKNKK